MKKIRTSTANFRTLVRRFPLKTIMPVVHGRTIHEIETSIEGIVRETRCPPWVGLGGIVPLLQNRYVSKDIFEMGPEVFIARSLALIRQAFPLSNVHAFGAGGTRTFPAIFSFGADSGDSIGWRQAAGYGSIFLPLKSQRVISWNRTKSPPRKILDDTDIAQIEICNCPICESRLTIDLKLSALREGFYNRSIHNAWIVSNQFKYWPKGRPAMASLIASGAFGAKWARASRYA